MLKPAALLPIRSLPAAPANSCFLSRRNLFLNLFLLLMNRSLRHKKLSGKICVLSPSQAALRLSRRCLQAFTSRALLANALELYCADQTLISQVLSNKFAALSSNTAQKQDIRFFKAAACASLFPRTSLLKIHTGRFINAFSPLCPCGNCYH